MGTDYKVNPLFSLSRLLKLGMGKKKAQELSREIDKLDKYEHRLWARVNKNEINGVDLERIPSV